MAKELPYFKFEPAEWQNGNIQMCSELTQLYFINMCCTYWSKLGVLKDRFAVVKCFNNNENLFNELLENEIIKVSNCGDVTISFLDTQLSEFKIKKKINAESGRKGGFNNGVRPEIERTLGNQLYLLECWNNEERFYKMGTTTSSISRRYSGKIQYQYKVVFQIFTDKFIEAEKELCELLRNYEYKPLLNFAGQKECYKYTDNQSIEEVINNYFDFAKASLLRNDAIREEKRRGKKRKEEDKPPAASKPFDKFSNSDEPNKIPEHEERKKVPQKKESLPLEMPPEFEPIWNEWTEYRADRKFKPYAGAKWEQKAIDKLLELSEGDPATARQILETTYQNNYQGFFPIKTQSNGKSNNKRINGRSSINPDTITPEFT